MIRTQISVDEEMYARAKDAARRQGISLAELCRRSLAQTLSRESASHPWMAYVGILRGPGGRTARPLTTWSTGASRCEQPEGVS